MAVWSTHNEEELSLFWRRKIPITVAGCTLRDNLHSCCCHMNRNFCNLLQADPFSQVSHTFLQDASLRSTMIVSQSARVTHLIRMIRVSRKILKIK